MTLNLGTVRPGSTIVVPFHTFDSNDPSASVAIAAFVLADIGIYKDLSMTERASTTGVVLLDTDGIDLDLAVGIGGFSIDLSSNATAGFYASGSRYYVTVGPVTVDAAVVNFLAATFDIGWPDALINTTVASATSDTQFILTDGPAEADVLIGCPIVIQAVAAARGVGIQIGYITDYIVTTKEVFIAADPGGGTVTAADHVAIKMPSNVRAVGGTLQTPIDLGNEIGTAGVGLAEAGGDGDHLTAITGAALSATGADLILKDSTFALAMADAIWDEILTGATHNIASSAGRRLRQLETGVVLDSGTADAGGNNTIDLETGVAVATDDYYNHTRVIITGGTGVGQERIIADYVGATQQATITPAWVTNPDATSTYDITPGTVHTETQGGGYEGGAVWIAATGATTSMLYVDGTVDNPIADSSLAAAKVVADALNLKVIHCLPGSSITLDDTYDGYEFRGAQYTIAFGGQSIDATVIDGCTISGIFTGVPHITDAEINGITGPGADIHDSALMNATASITASGSGTFLLHECYSGIAGATTPLFDFGTTVGNSTNLSMGSYHNGIEIANMNNQGTDLFSLSGDGQVILAASSSGTANIRGHWKITNTGGLTIVTDDLLTDVAAILVDTNSLNDGAIAELAQAAPSATPTLQNAVMLLYMALRNKTSVQTSGTDALEINNNAGTIIAKKLLTDDGSDYVEAEMVSGP